MRRPIFAGNWKMNLTIDEGLALAGAVHAGTTDVAEQVEIIVSPTAVALYPTAKALGDSHVAVAAQNCHWVSNGAYTGELSPTQLKAAGCTHVIIGHSERRTLFGETDDGVSRKARSLLDHGLTPIICVGETLAEREGEQTLDVVSRQINAALAALSGDEIKRSIIAYEPVWAIGTGRTATPAQAQEVHSAIRSLVSERFGVDVGDAVRILYGGSVKPANIAGLMSQPDIDGGLVGGASLKADSFNQIARYQEGSN
ncbi:MAG: triose-phosphate isomerase [Bradymonadia bacterium]